MALLANLGGSAGRGDAMGADAYQAHGLPSVNLRTFDAKINNVTITAGHGSLRRAVEEEHELVCSGGHKGRYQRGHLHTS